MPIAARILGKTSQIVVQGGKTANQIGHNQAALIAGPNFGGRMDYFAPGTLLFAPEWVQVGDDIDEGGYSRKNIATPVILRRTPRISLAFTLCL